MARDKANDVSVLFDSTQFDLWLRGCNLTKVKLKTLALCLNQCRSAPLIYIWARILGFKRLDLPIFSPKPLLSMLGSVIPSQHFMTPDSGGNLWNFRSGQFRLRIFQGLNREIGSERQDSKFHHASFYHSAWCSILLNKSRLRYRCTMLSKFDSPIIPHHIAKKLYLFVSGLISHFHIGFEKSKKSLYPSDRRTLSLGLLETRWLAVFWGESPKSRMPQSEACCLTGLRCLP